MSRTAVIRPLLFLALLALPMFSLNACNTVEGAGQDMQSGGRAVERAADKNK